MRFFFLTVQRSYSELHHQPRRQLCEGLGAVWRAGKAEGGYELENKAARAIEKRAIEKENAMEELAGVKKNGQMGTGQGSTKHKAAVARQ